MRRWNSRSATRSSMRARCDPRQRCGPPPKARWRLGLRVKSTTSGSGNSAGSVLAAPSNGLTRSPLLIGQPPTSVSCVATRATPGTGILQRQPEQLQEDGAWQRNGELVVEVAFAPLGEAVNHLVHQLGDARFAPGHLPRGEQGVEDATVLRVLRRVDLQRDHRSDVAEVD